MTIINPIVLAQFHRKDADERGGLLGDIIVTDHLPLDHPTDLGQVIAPGNRSCAHVSLRPGLDDGTSYVAISYALAAIIYARLTQVRATVRLPLTGNSDMVSWCRDYVGEMVMTDFAHRVAQYDRDASRLAQHYHATPADITARANLLGLTLKG